MLTLNGHTVEVSLFPDNTSQVWKLPERIFNAPRFDITWDYSSEADFIHLAQLKMLLDHHITSQGQAVSQPVVLEITYLPYARQDKPVANDATFALRAFAPLLNSLNFTEIAIHDPHSAVALELIHHSKALYPIEDVKAVVAATGADLICYPDKGARTRYASIYPFASIYGEKVRNQQTGRITSYEVVGDPKQKRVMIVDDICDGGATFTILTRELLAKGAVEVNLFITHGLFSKGLAEIHAAGVKRIFTRDGEASETQNKIVYKEL